MDTQTFQEVIGILKSQLTVKGIRIQVNARFFGVEWADGQAQETFVGEISGWKKKNESLMIKWEGWQRNTQCPLSALDVDSEGESLCVALLPYSDGRSAPVLHHREDRDEEADGTGSSADTSDEEDKPGEVQEEVGLTLKNPMKPLDISSMIWKKKIPEGIAVDERQQERFKPSLPTQLELKDIVSLFYYLYPEEWIELQLKHTNPRLQGHDKLNAKLDKGELLQFWGYCLALSLHTGISLEKMWSDKPIDESILPPPSLGKHGMCLNRFKKIRSALSFGPSDATSLREDPWAFVRPLVDTFNAHRKSYVTPGWLVTADESMIAWRGQVGLLDPLKCPHRSWVPRKPEPLGVELKTAGDALSSIMLQMEICEGKDAMKEKEFSSEWGATTACTMRLFQPWHGTRRVVAADSWFAGVKTARAMLDCGLHFVGDVKTNTSLFPKDALQSATGPESGAWATCSAMLSLNNGAEVPIFSVSHRRGESVHAFICTCGTTLAGEATKAYFEDEEERANSLAFEVTRKAPRILNDYTLAQPCIDRHNRYRQFILAMEKRLVTNSFNFRFGTSMHAVVFTDVFFAFRYFVDSDADIKAQLGRLAYHLMHNSFLKEGGEQVPSPPSAGRRSSSSPHSSSDDHAHHELCRLQDVTNYMGGRQQRCIFCNRKTIWCCKLCSSAPALLVPLCPLSSKVRGNHAKSGHLVKHVCLVKHRTNPCLIPNNRKNAKRARCGATDGSESQEECEEDDDPMVDEVDF